MSQKIQTIGSIIGNDLVAFIEHLAETMPDMTETPDAISRADADRRRLIDDRIRDARSYVSDADYNRILRGEVDTQAWTATERFLEAHRAGKAMRFLMLNGGTGIGKTVAAVNAMAVTDRSSRFLPVSYVIRAFWQETETAKKIQETIESVPMLVIDDIGTGKDRDKETSAVYEAVNCRQGNGKITILTSNIPKDRIKEYDARLVERITHQGAIITLGGESKRRKQT